MIFAYIFPYNAHAKGLVFQIDPELLKPKLIYRPYPNEFHKPKKDTRNRIISKPKKNTVVKNENISADRGRNYSSEEIQAIIVEYSNKYGIASGTPLCIAKKESGWSQYSKNKSSSASGVFQYVSATWASTDEGKSGESIFNPESNIKAAIKYMASRKSTSPWISTAKNCPKLSFL